jgi:hypothetical protein
MSAGYREDEKAHQRCQAVCVILTLFLVLCWSLGVRIELQVMPAAAPVAGAEGGADAEIAINVHDVDMGFERVVGSNAASPVLGVNSDTSSLEFAKDTKPILLWERADSAKPPTGDRTVVPRKARMACMYAGFMRNWEWMMATCREMQPAKFCSFPRCAKLFGNQRKNLLESTGCDVYISTWQIRGTGRFFTHTYDNSDVLPLDRVQRLYEKYLYAFHVQNYSLYQGIWEEMHRYSRVFPQTHPTVLAEDKNSWAGVPETNNYIRRNDYSQSYKHWCVLQLVLRSKVDYDFYFRLRTDLRMTRPMLNPTVTAVSALHPGRATSVTFQMEYMNGTRSTHLVNQQRVHVNNFDVGDFGFGGLPEVVRPLSERLWHYCVADPDQLKGRKEGEITHPLISEYNLMLWRVIFDAHWAVDSGNRYLWVSRSATKCKKKKAERERARLIALAAARARATTGGNESSSTRFGATTDDDDE